MVSCSNGDGKKVLTRWDAINNCHTSGLVIKHKRLKPKTECPAMGGTQLVNQANSVLWQWKYAVQMNVYRME